MHISSVKLTNFRCFGAESESVSLNLLTAFVGSNGCGKSAVLEALVRMFGTSQLERTLVRTDFHLPSGTSWDDVDEASLSVEVRFDFEELDVEGSAEDAPAACFKHMIISAPRGRPYCRMRLDGLWKRSNLPEGEIQQKLIWITTPVEHSGDESSIAVQPYDRSRIHMHYIPASRDPLRQIRSASGSMLHNLFQAVKWSKQVREEVSAASNKMCEAFREEAGVGEIESALQTAWQKLHPGMEYSEVSVRPTAKRLEDILRQVEMKFGPGVADREEGAESLSDGQKSLLYFAMVSALFEVERIVGEGEEESFSKERLNPPILKLFGAEEPENHIAPHYLGGIVSLLRLMATGNRGQILLTSHSPAILSRIEPEEVRHLRLDSATRTTRIRKLVLPKKSNDAHKFIREAVKAYPELYFARFVLLGEGDSEEIVLPKLAISKNISIDRVSVSIVPLGGRHVNHMWRLLEQLEIPYATLLDFDRERKGGGWGRIKYVLKQLLEVGKSEDEVLVYECGGTNKRIKREGLETMHRRDVEQAESQKAILDHLERHGVFFSYPLDLDLMMLRAFPAAYEAAAEDGDGPEIPEDPRDYEQAEKALVATVLKDAGTDGNTYDEEEKRAFFWYRYLFLGRGKPSTHIMALSKVSDMQADSEMPQVLQRLMAYMKDALPDGI